MRSVLTLLVGRRGDAARRRGAEEAVRRCQEFVHVGLAIAPRLAAAPVHFPARKYAPTATVAQGSLRLTALFVPSSGLRCHVYVVCSVFFVHYFLFRDCSVRLAIGLNNSRSSASTLDALSRPCRVHLLNRHSFIDELAPLTYSTRTFSFVFLLFCFYLCYRMIYFMCCFYLFCFVRALFTETEVTTTRPFGQPLCLVNENGDPPPSILKSTASVRKK